MIDVGRLYQSYPVVRVLRALRGIPGPTLWLAGGYLRAACEDRPSSYEGDVDVVYVGDGAKDREHDIERVLHRALPGYRWDVADQTRHGYETVEDAVWGWTRNAPGAAVRLDASGKILVIEALPYTTLRGEVARCIRKRGAAGATCAEVEEALGGLHQSVSPRIFELRKIGLVVDSGQRRETRTGRTAIVWVSGAASTTSSRGEPDA